MSNICRLATLCLLSTLAWTAEAAVNLITNPSFETELNNWDKYVRGDAQAVVSISTKHHGEGKAALHISNVSPASPNVYLSLSQNLVVKPDTTYRLSLRIKATNAKGIGFGGGPEWTVRMNCPVGTYDWRTVEMTYKTATGENQFLFRLWSEDLTESAYIDDVTMVEVAH